MVHFLKQGFGQNADLFYDIFNRIIFITLKVTTVIHSIMKEIFKLSNLFFFIFSEPIVEPDGEDIIFEKMNKVKSVIIVGIICGTGMEPADIFRCSSNVPQPK